MPRIIKTTVYDIHELDNAAKAEARDWYVQHVLATTAIWHEHVFDDFETICGLLGITILTRPETQRGQHPARAVRCIWFSGFASQGDGACFEGDWKHATGTSRHIREYAPQDKTLHQIADALTRAQKRNFYQLAGVMRHEGHYSHEYCMKVDIERENEHHQEPTEDSVETVTKAMRELARWLYRHIETTWTDQTSDPIVDEEIHANEWAFTAKGAYFAA